MIGQKKNQFMQPCRKDTKDPNELTDEDFAKITKFLLKEKELSDIKLLDKFTNVQKLYLINIK